MYQLSELLNAIIIGDVRKALKKIPSNSVRCGVTSPPYFGLRDYGTAIWVGGDEKCDHKKTSAATINTSLAKSTLAGGMEGARISYENKQTNKHTCNRCGAVRIDNQIGLEKTPEKFIQHLVEVFREFRRILKEDGTLWVNIGDSYWGSGNSGGHTGETLNMGKKTSGYGATKSHTVQKHKEIKPKDLVGIPWMLAFALRADGWYLRQDIIWHKPNPMPESVTDRCTKSHEYIFLLSKSPKYYYDSYAIKQPIKESSISRLNQDIENQQGSERANGGIRADRPMKAVRKSGNLMRKEGVERGCPEDSGSNVCGNVPWEGDMANKKSVWTISTKPFTGAHFATFPQTLIQDCIKAGTSEKGQCADCGKPWQRITEKELINEKPPASATFKREGSKREQAIPGQQKGTHRPDRKHSGNTATITTGWQPTCECHGKIIIHKIKIEQDDDIPEEIEEDFIVIRKEKYKKVQEYIPAIPLEDHPVVPDVVMDLFGGAGTTHLVSNKLGRQSISTELNPLYVKDITVPRLQKELGMFNSVKIIEL